MSSEISAPDPVFPDAPASRWSNRILVVLFAAVVAPVGASVLYAFPPTEYSFLPCWFNLLTGMHCPGCGATRSAHALLHGEWEQAVAWNPLFVLALPLLVYVGFSTTYEMWTGRRLGPRTPGWAVTFLLIVLVGFWIVRNIDVYPLNQLAPHAL
ncbi:MAG: DUF2752 domain-containing protein [Gemmataceae bacterium]|nr:DUF2752 domain-containing protein [Gemmataceae bacterium]